MLPHGEVMVVFTDYVKYILCHLLQFSVEIQSISKVKRTVQCSFVSFCVGNPVFCVFLVGNI